MTRRSTYTLCGLALAAGIVIGTALDSARLASRVAAETPTQVAAAAERWSPEGEFEGDPLFQASRRLARIAELTTPSVVHIQSSRTGANRGKIEETGSGVIVTNDKSLGVFVVTNRHVVASAELPAISIHLHDGRVVQPSRVWSDKATDLAVLKIEAAGVQPARWGDSDELEIGHMVLAMGSPFGLSQSVTLGIISAKGRRSLKLGPNSDVLNQNFLQTDAAINPGNSGGPLIDLRGRVIGINTAIASNSGGNDGIGFSIPSNLARRVVDELLEVGAVQRAYLGVKLDPDFNVSAARRLTLDRVRGARVVEVYANTPASRANLKYDDVILSFGDVDVLDENHLINLVSLTPVERAAKVVVLREGKKLTLDVQLGDRADLERRAQTP
ncbi:MAG: trypsin-like peptidase domain-containing protein [Planctomycetales bacterium]